MSHKLRRGKLASTSAFWMTRATFLLCFRKVDLIGCIETANRAAVNGRNVWTTSGRTYGSCTSLSFLFILKHHTRDTLRLFSSLCALTSRFSLQEGGLPRGLVFLCSHLLRGAEGDANYITQCLTNDVDEDMYIHSRTALFLCCNHCRLRWSTNGAAFFSHL